MLSKQTLMACLLLTVPGCGDDSAATGGAGPGGGGGGGGSPVCFTPSADPAAPSPESVQFQGLGPIPAGERLLFNDWAATPNEIVAALPDGTGESVVLRAFRVWAFGVSNDRTKLAFAAGDPMQEENFGITIGDAIQPTFVYDTGCNTVGALTFGNLNDECHHFGPGDDYLYLCRRYDFTSDAMFKGYRAARVLLATGALEWLTPEEPSVFAIAPRPTPDETAFYYYRVEVGGTRSVVKRTIADGSESVVRTGLGAPTLSADGSILVAPDQAQQGSLIAIDLTSGTETLIARGQNLNTATFSPDGTRVAFLRFDDTASCSDIEIVTLDGSLADTPELVHDCSESGRFVTELAWVP